MLQRRSLRILREATSVAFRNVSPISSFYRNTSNKAGYFSEEACLDPLKQNFDKRQNKIFGSMDAIKLSEADQKRLMPEDNIAAVLNKPLEVEIREMERPSIIQPWEVLINVDHTGICGSDLEYYKHGVIGPFELKQPMIMGHESGGTVLALGKAVNNGLKVGDKVALEPGIIILSANTFCNLSDQNIYTQD